MFDGGNKFAQTPLDAGAVVASPEPVGAFSAIKAALRRDVGDTAFRSWISPLEYVSFSAGVLTLGVPTRFVRDWVRTHYADTVRALWGQATAPCLRIDFVVNGRKPEAENDAQPEVSNENAVVTTASPVAVSPAAAEIREDISSPLDLRFTFDNFVTGPANALAYAAALRVAEDAAPAHNPLFFAGGVGLGKTHLMQAIAHAVRTKFPQRRVVYMSAEKFMYRFVRALRARDTFAFKEAFRSIDMLMIDDIQFICGKESTQQEFFHTFNALLDQGRQVVLSADKSPAALENIDPRLQSRLGMGLVAPLAVPDEALRRAILQAKCKMMQRDLQEDVLALLAARITTSVRALEGALNRLIAHAELVGRAVDTAAAEEILHDVLSSGDNALCVAEIQKCVAAYYNIRVADILSPRRARPLARPRQVAMYLSKMLTEKSLPDIGRRFGGRDHTTIIHGVKRIETLMREDQVLRNDVETLRRSLSA